MKIDKGSPIDFNLSGLHKRIQKLESICPFPFADAVDYGAGKGSYSVFLNTKVKSLTAFDIDIINLSGIKDLQQGKEIKLVITSGSKTCFRSGSFDALFAIEVLEHIDDIKAGIKEIKRILKNDGLAYITVPNKYFPLETHHVYLFGKPVDGRLVPFLSMSDSIHNKIGSSRRFSVKSLAALFELEGFEIVGFDYIMPPFDNFKMGKRFIKPVTDIIESSIFRFLGSNIVAVFRKK